MTPHFRSFQSDIDGTHRLHVFALDPSSSNILGFAEGHVDGQPLAKLDRLFVDPTVRKSGIGRLLLNEFENWVIFWDCTEVSLTLHPDTTAEGFYTRFGYELRHTYAYRGHPREFGKVLQT